MFKLVAQHESIHVYQATQEGKTITRIESGYNFPHVVGTWHNTTPIHPPCFHSMREQRFVENFFQLFGGF